MEILGSGHGISRNSWGAFPLTPPRRRYVFIDPGSPWQDAWTESFNGRFRDELLDLWQFDSLLKARVIIKDWRIDYTINRPHTANGDLTQSEFAAKPATTNPPQAVSRLDRLSGPLSAG